MYLLIQESKYHIAKEAEQADAVLCVFSYEEMEQCAKEYDISMPVLEQARHFGFAKYDSFEDFDCMSLEMQNFDNIFISHGSVIVYIKAQRAYFFTSQVQRVSHMLHTCAEALGDRISFSRMLYLFLEAQTKEDDIAFDTIEKEILALEQEIITAQQSPKYVTQIIGLRKRLMLMKRYYEQFLNVLDMAMENENHIFDAKTLRSLQILSRRTERSYQNILNLQESVTQVRESYEAEVDINLNTTMKIFTVVTTIFLPLTLIAGWYGMNFEMPEYHWGHGYIMVIVLSVLCVVGGIAFFKKKKWF